MVPTDPFACLSASGPSHPQLLPPAGSPQYAEWVQHRQLDEAAVSGSRDRRRLARALRRARRLRQLNERAWARVAGAEDQLHGVAGRC